MIDHCNWLGNFHLSCINNCMVFLQDRLSSIKFPFSTPSLVSWSLSVFFFFLVFQPLVIPFGLLVK